MTFMDIPMRRKIALRFGKQEHLFGRLIAIPILCGILFNIYLHKSWHLSEWNSNENVNLYFFVTIFFCWLIYLISHTLEKQFYGQNAGFRGRRQVRK
jgi:hypothetical protein